MKQFWTMSLRTRLMIIGLAGVGIALIMGGLAFFAALTYSVNRTLDNEALASAEEVAAMVNENRLPSPDSCLRRASGPGGGRPATGDRQFGDSRPANPAAGAE